MLYASWRTNVKLVWGLPRNCKSDTMYFVSSSLIPPNVSLMLRFHKFFLHLLESPSKEVQVISRLSARDMRSNKGKNLSYLQDLSGLNPWEYGTNRLKQEILGNSRHLERSLPGEAS